MGDEKNGDRLENAVVPEKQRNVFESGLSEDDAHRERRLLTKLDLVIMPLTALLYLSAYLDRGNIGNARLQGLQATLLDGSDTKYSVVLTAFFST
jgi:hypothetical protein